MLQQGISTDGISLENPDDNLKKSFSELIEKKAEEAVTWLNSEDLNFAFLFVLEPIIKKHNILEHMSMRNRVALCITDEILTGSKNVPPEEFSASEYIQEINSTLKWMLSTGCAHDGLSSDYDTVLDGCAALLVRVYGDKSVLPIITDLIFQRNRKGSYYNDLAWVFFESRYPYGLILIVSYFRSEELKDIELARKFLNFIPVANTSRRSGKEGQYLAILHWVEENSPFLYYTGESFQLSMSPKPYRVVLKAKYLCKPVSADTGDTLEPLTDKEKKLADAFNALDDNTRVILSEYSLRLHNNNIFLWKEWIGYPVEEQAKAAWFWMGGA